MIFCLVLNCKFLGAFNNSWDANNFNEPSSEFVCSDINSNLAAAILICQILTCVISTNKFIIHHSHNQLIPDPRVYFAEMRHPLLLITRF